MAAPAPGATSFSALISRLTDATTSPDDLLKALSDLRERLEVVHTLEYPRFLEVTVGPLVQLLTRTSPQFQENAIHRYDFE